MKYVTSDLHGYPLEKFKHLLEQAGFGKGDELYVLGDVIDRNGDGGIEMLRWMIKQPEIHFLRGNHEDMLLKSLFLFEESSPAYVSRSQYSAFSCWVWNGGEPTINSLRELKKNNPAAFDEIISYLQKAPVYRELTVDGRRYILTHGGIGNYEQGRPLDSYEDDDFIWFRPDIDTEYGDDAKVICGHTPVFLFGEEYAGRPLVRETWIDIDTGAAYGVHPTILRLEDERAFCVRGSRAA